VRSFRIAESACDLKFMAIDRETESRRPVAKSESEARRHEEVEASDVARRIAAVDGSENT
jgi:hypothetical protein